MASRPWYAFYPKDYEQKTAHLTFLQDSAYRRLLDRYYMSGDPLPANAEQLHRVCRAFDDAEKAAIAFVLAEFFTLTANGYIQERVQDELEKAESLSEKRRTAAKTRYEKGDANAPANAEQKHTQSQSQSQEKKESSLRSDSPCGSGTSKKKTSSRSKQKPEHPDFTKFWEVFPLHVGRLKAVEKYSAAIESGALPADLLAGALRYAQQRRGEDPKFTAHPATWLNQRRWLDEEIKTKGHIDGSRASNNSRNPPNNGFGATVSSVVDERARRGILTGDGQEDGSDVTDAISEADRNAAFDIEPGDYTGGMRRMSA